MDLTKPFKPVVSNALPIRIWGPPTTPIFQRPFVPSIPPPRLLISINGHNIVCHEGQYYVVPQKLGTLHFDKQADRSKPGVRRFGNEADARKAVGL